MKRRRLIFIVGPTASGKTALAISEAERTRGPILSCDSLCVYRGMDIGTAKPTREEQARVPHYGIDLCEAKQRFSVADYISYRDGILEHLIEETDHVYVVGGSGFYLKSFFAPVVDPFMESREALDWVADLESEEGLEGMLRALRAFHGPGEPFEGLDLRNPRRVAKALVRCRSTGKSYGDLRRAFLAQPEPLATWEKEVRLLEWPNGILQARNRKRVQSMLAEGLVEEVSGLRAQGFEANSSAASAIGYRECLKFLDGAFTSAELEEEVYVHTNQLMRKQRTWFRKQMPAGQILRMGET